MKKQKSTLDRLLDPASPLKSGLSIGSLGAVLSRSAEMTPFVPPRVSLGLRAVAVPAGMLVGFNRARPNMRSDQQHALSIGTQTGFGAGLVDGLRPLASRPWSMTKANKAALAAAIGKAFVRGLQGSAAGALIGTTYGQLKRNKLKKVK